MATLICTTKGGDQVITLGDRATLGRHPSSDVQVLDSLASKEHCRVERAAEGWVLHDLDSFNGTFLNGLRVRGTTKLKHFDEILIGATRFTFSDVTEPLGASKDAVEAAAGVMETRQSPRDPIAPANAQPRVQVTPGNAPTQTGALDLARRLAARVRDILVEREEDRIARAALTGVIALASAEYALYCVFLDDGAVSPRQSVGSKPAPAQMHVELADLIQIAMKTSTPICSLRGDRFAVVLPVTHNDHGLGVMLLSVEATRAVPDLELLSTLASVCGAALRAR
jgi:pSer/pThr/pTyr-binding forkhead associated (FHA) protein